MTRNLKTLLLALLIVILILGVALIYQDALASGHIESLESTVNSVHRECEADQRMMATAFLLYGQANMAYHVGIAQKQEQAKHDACVIFRNAEDIRAKNRLPYIDLFHSMDEMREYCTKQKP